MSGESYAPKSPDLSALFADSEAPPVAPGGHQALNVHYGQQYGQQSQYAPQVQQQKSQPQPSTQQAYQPPPHYYSTTQQPHQHQQAQRHPQNLTYSQSPLQHQPQFQHQHQLQNQHQSQQPYAQPPHPQQQNPQSPYYQSFSASQYQPPTSAAASSALPQYGQRYQSPGDLFGTEPFAGDSFSQQHPRQQQSLSFEQQQRQLLQPLQQEAYGQPVALPDKSEADTGTMPPRRSAAAAAAAAPQPPVADASFKQQKQSLSPPLLAPTRATFVSPVRTKFPTARIKRIMQADEEVGKVSQQTPIAVGKALEMFMVDLVSKSADMARAKNSKRVTAQILKEVIESDDQWDFLHSIAKKVDSEEKHGRGPRNSTGGAGASEGGGGGFKPKLESDSGDDQPKKRGRPARKKNM
ncbi:hypothetical protein SEPCBS57363_002477 [Sporothrix epigloea]|uniref:Transcription factor CBF/NF-Y/archaeal histone domain-containing protein n=1 Tax=Sporothrix epigloea TaxID=1892477 RepID=A0ABP0DG44_9PEZI